MNAIFLLGMHRSGTSAVAQLVSRFGVRIGRASDRIEPGPDNPDGFWESFRLARFNERLLERLGGSWYSPPTASRSAAELATGATAWRGRLEFVRVYGLRSSPLLWKDPRNCLLGDFWVRALPFDPRYIYVFRNPLEVARSLETRNGIPIPAGLALWERYNHAALERLKRRPAFVLAYEDVLATPTETAAELYRYLQFHNAARTAKAPAMQAKAVQPSLRHNVATTDELSASSAASTRLRDLYDFLLGIRGRHEPFDRTSPSETPDLDAQLALISLSTVR